MVEIVELVDTRECIVNLSSSELVLEFVHL